MSTKLFAMWEHGGCDMYSPTTVLGGVIKRFDDDGYVHPEGFSGYKFRPAIVLPVAAGKKAIAEFRALEESAKAAHKKFVAEWSAKYRELKGKHGIR